MVQAVFDDENEVTRQLWEHADIRRWDPDRNTAEFVAAMPEWRQHGLVGITVGLQGGNPINPDRSYLEERLSKYDIKVDDSWRYSSPWDNSAFEANGNLKKAYFERLGKVLDRADELGMVVILDLFYWGQDQRMQEEAAIKRAVEGSCAWVLEQGYTNVVIEIANECDLLYYDHEIFKTHRIHQLIDLAKNVAHRGCRLLVSTSFVHGIPHDSAIVSSDFALLHGNAYEIPEMIKRMVSSTRDLPGYRPMPIVINEDDHYDFDLPDNNFMAALASYAGWGFLDTSPGFQRIPTNWRINRPLQKAFFGLLAEATGSE